MHLKSITLKGFKSFPDRTRLEFGPGVSVIVGPNGSGKSNITDAVLWALGEQSPLAVRGQSMQDVIFGGARGQQARRTAEVELVIETDGDADGRRAGSGLEFPEISIRRRLERAGEGEYRLNGSRCRLVDVLEVLSDTGLGKEMHSVVSQGRVESVVTSRPRDRRLLIEEAAGLGKHRKRRRRAQLKLDRTQDNLDRALDVEHEARSRLRPLKRQAEAAELHERLERQDAEARWELARDVCRGLLGELDEAEAAAARARSARDEVERGLADVAGRRDAAEQALARRADRHDALAARRFAVRSAQERVALRLEQAGAAAGAVGRRAEAASARLSTIEASPDIAAEDRGGRLSDLEGQLRELDLDPGERPDDHLQELEGRRQHADAECARLEGEARERRDAVTAAAERWRAACEQRRAAESAVGTAERDRARLAARIAAADEFLRTRSQRWGAAAGARALADELEAQPGYELALAAALAGRLTAAVVSDRRAGSQLLDRSPQDGGRALVAPGAASSRPGGAPPAPGAERLVERVGGRDPSLSLARSLLADAWVVESLDAVADDFAGIAVTRAGRAWLGSARELHQAPAGGEERILSERNRRAALEADHERAVEAERAAAAAASRASEAVRGADAERESAEAALGETLRERDRAAEERRRATWLIDQRRSTDRGPDSGRRAELEAALAAERRLTEQAERGRRERAARVEAERARLARARGLRPRAERLTAALAATLEAADAHGRALDGELEADRTAGEGLAAQLRACAQDEAALQTTLRERAEALTGHEVAAQRLRDRLGEAQAELHGLAGRLGLADDPAPQPLSDDEREALGQRIVRLARRREQLGPVNPLAQDEYAEALAHVEDLEDQRRDLETAMRELQSLIADTDRRIRESFEQTFEATSRNFEELVGQLFPGGRGRLRLVREADGPAPVLGGRASSGDGDSDGDPDAVDDEGPTDAEDRVGIEIEMTPAGKAMKRLSLLSGGEKSLTALAFLFAIFLARPCPFYVLDEVEAALDDLNIDRFLRLLRRYSRRAQFIVVTHQKRTMEAADTLYGVSMGDDGVSKVISRRLPREDAVGSAADAA